MNCDYGAADQAPFDAVAEAVPWSEESPGRGSGRASADHSWPALFPRPAGYLQVSRPAGMAADEQAQIHMVSRSTVRRGRKVNRRSRPAAGAGFTSTPDSRAMYRCVAPDPSLNGAPLDRLLGEATSTAESIEIGFIWAMC